LRVTLQIRDNGIGVFKWPVENERKLRGLTDSEYPNSGNHIAVFECQLKLPPLMMLSDHTHKDFLWATRLNFTGWKLVDIDNYMKGNPHFTKKDIADPLERLPNVRPLEEVLGEDFHKEPLEKKDLEAFIAEVKETLRKLDTFEPNSNARLGLERSERIAEQNSIQTQSEKTENKGKKAKK